MLNIIASTIPRGYGGAGDYLSYILARHPEHRLIAPRITALLRNPTTLRKAIYVCEVAVVKVCLFMLAGLKIVRSVVIHHPQSLGYVLTSKLIRSSEEVHYWVIDASFFCKQSYNHYRGYVCTHCLDEDIPYDDCRHFPKRLVFPAMYSGFKTSVRTHLSKIFFHVQTDSYNKLVSKAFPGARVTLEKMLIPDFYPISSSRGISKDEFDFLFHANPLAAKGYGYFLTLSEKMKNRRFFVPNRCGNIVSQYDNVRFEAVYWGNGLQEKIVRSRVVLCPSLWSAPLEAAVIKSFLLEKPVGLVDADYGLTRVLPAGCFILLTGSPETDAEILESALADESSLRRIAATGKAWAEQYIGPALTDANWASRFDEISRWNRK